MQHKAIRNLVLAASAATVIALTPGSAHAAGSIPPKPEYCLTGKCVLGCFYNHPLAPFGAVSTDLRFCRAIQAPVQWIFRGRGR